MDFQELIGILFTLYILGSMVAGFFRRSRQGPPADGDEKRASRGGLPEVLDMDELERRLRELAGDRLGRPKTSVPEPLATPKAEGSTAASSRPAPAPAVAVRSQSQPRPAAAVSRRSGSGPDGWRGTDEEWGGWTDEPWESEEASAVSRRGRRVEPGSLPPAVETYLRKGNPWQAAFVVKELLGPPRALSPHRNSPRR